ncbi:IS3 family transposase [Streptomyces atratus]|uniref:Integrase catalytic domain-containing protein n=1 Tax=Streptomyces atratus TaxID=1893 RepID=A0A2Z5JNB3_STRAR|nr:hypothetical protein C5746_38990 [Streptomyces atratus]
MGVRFLGVVDLAVHDPGVREAKVSITRAQATTALFEYVDGFCNPRRIQKRLDWLSPNEYEHTYHASQATTGRLRSTALTPTPTS